MAARSIRRFVVGISVVVLVSGFAAGSSASAATLYVIPSGGATSGSCDSWAAACTLQTALGTAASGDEIWVEKGIYKPGASALDTFTIPPGVAVYGGFAGTETARSERNPVANITVLSGDIAGNDNVDANGIDETYNDIVPNSVPSDNSHNVVTMDGTQGTKVLSDTVLDGFTITGGYGPGQSGAGLYCKGRNAGNECSPTLANLVFSGNMTGGGSGGALSLDGYYGGVSSPSLTNVRFNGNHTSYEGGAVLVGAAYGGTSNPTFDHCTFANNSAQYGGAIYDQAEVGGTASPAFADVVFDNNYASTNGGAMDNDGNGNPGSFTGGIADPTLTRVTFSNNHSNTQGGAIYNASQANIPPASTSSSPILTNVTFWGNHSGAGGAIYDQSVGGGKSDPILTNVTFSGNYSVRGGAIYNNGDSSGASDASPTLVNVILWGDTATGSAPNGPEIWNSSYPNNNGFAQPTISYSVVENGDAGSSTNGGADTAWSGGTGNLSGNPNLLPLQFNGGFTDTAALGAGSSAIDTAEGSPACPTTDERGISRPQGAACDIGAYEAQSAAPACLANTSVTFNYLTPPFDTAPPAAPGIRSLTSAFQSGQLQSYTVPAGAAAVLITAQGASGGTGNTSPAQPGGYGAEVAAEVPVAAGTSLDVLVGAVGGAGQRAGGGGGGGSFVFTTGGDLLVAAGGGGGGGYDTSGSTGRSGELGPNGSNGEDGGGTPPHGGIAGTGGYGGAAGTTNIANGGGGGGFLGAGGTAGDGYSGSGGHQISGTPPDGGGGAGETAAAYGGYGGYGGGGGGGQFGGGGGGGFSGGGGGSGDPAPDGGGGGGSYAAAGATYLAFSTLASAGDGSVTICVTRRASILAIPTLSPWALLLLALGLALAATPMLVRRS